MPAVVEFLVVERARVDPLDEVLEVAGARGGEVDACGVGFAEGVGGVEGGGEEGGGGAEAFAVDWEGDAVRADGYGDDGFEEVAGWDDGAARVGAGVGVFDGGRGGRGGGGGGGWMLDRAVAGAVDDDRHLPGCRGYLACRG